MFEIYGTVCHLCGHGGAREADHLIPLRDLPNQTPDPHAMRPAHGALYRRRDGTVLRDNRCPECGKACNQSRGAKPLSAVAAPAIEDYEDDQW